MKQRIFALIAVLAGAAAGTAVTAYNDYWYREARETLKDGQLNLLVAKEIYGREDMAKEQSFLLQRDIADFAGLSDVDQEKVMAFVRKLASEKKDGSDISDMRKAEDENTDSKTEAESDGSEDFPGESAFSGDTAPHDVAQVKGEDEDEKEGLVAEYLRRVENVYGHSKESRVMAANAKPVRNSRTGYAYISISDAAKKTGCSASYIHHSCLSNNRQGGAWCYISQTEYAKMPEEKIEVETKNQRTKEEQDELHDFT